MEYDHVIERGSLGQYDEPDWEPLEAFLPLALCGGFMWMNDIELDSGGRIQAYKHSITRHYLHLDADADAWESLGRGRYRRMRHSDAIEQAFPPWWLLDHATDEECDAIRAALKAAHERGNGDRGAGAHILPSSPACGFRELP